jgi:RNA polymerase sigma-70 factor (ECF subfamily)
MMSSTPGLVTWAEAQESPFMCQKMTAVVQETDGPPRQSIISIDSFWRKNQLHTMDYRINLKFTTHPHALYQSLIGWCNVLTKDSLPPALSGFSKDEPGGILLNRPTACTADAGTEGECHAAKDITAMKRLMGGDDFALNELMDRHADRLFQYLFRALQNQEDAADLAQETFVRVYQHRQRFDPQQNFSTWLYAIASNLVRNRYRWRSRHPQVALDSLDESGGADHSVLLKDKNPSPIEGLQNDELAEAIRKAVAGLPEDLRLTIILSEYEECSYAEIAQILNCTPKAVEMRLYRAKQQLRQKLQNVKEAL